MAAQNPRKNPSHRTLVSRACEAAVLLRERGYSDVANWLMAAYAREQERIRPRRRRGLRVRLARNGSIAVLDAARIAELTEQNVH